MYWISFALLGAIFQAVEAAIKKKALQVQGMNNVIAVIAFLFAGILLAMLYVFLRGTFLLDHELSMNFFQSVFWVVVLNVIAVWFNYKALDAADLSYLMPFMTLTSLSLILPPMFLLGEYPSMVAVMGIAIVVLGALMMDLKRGSLTKAEQQKRKENRRGVLYFSVTALCYTFTPTLMKIAVVESNPLFASYVVHLLIGIAFIPLIFLIPATITKVNESGIKERIKLSRSQTLVLIREYLTSDSAMKFLFVALLAGLAIAISNGSINYALQYATVANVFAIKRTMPLFAFAIAVLYFKERSDLKKKMIATCIMIVGAIIITMSK